VLGSERHESRRIDNQLRGRSGRQGDPGESQFFVSTEDDLMRIFGGERIGAIMERLRVDDETPIENRIISKSLEAAQKKVEGFNFDQRKNVVEYDDVMNRHRKAVYSMRREILLQTDIKVRVSEFIKEEVKALVASPQSMTEEFEAILKEVFPFDEKTLDKIFDAETDKFEKVLLDEVENLYKGKEKAFGADILRKIERDVYLQILDTLWMQHLENMDHLREGIHWISVGQKDPLVEYRRQSQILFGVMQNDLRHDVLRTLYNAEPIPEDQLDRSTETELTRAARGSVDNADKILDVEEFEEEDFKPSGQKNTKVASRKNQRNKKRKAERKNRQKGKRKKK